MYTGLETDDVTYTMCVAMSVDYKHDKGQQ